MEKTKVCKYCKTEIDAKAKVCPNCRKKQSHKVRWIIIILVVLFCSSLAPYLSENNEPRKVNTAENKNANKEEKTTAQEYFAKGDAVELKGVTTTLVNVTEYASAGEYLKPAEGKIFVLCEFEIQNNSDDDISVSSVMSFESYCDGYSVDQSLSALQADESKNQLDGSVAAGKKMNGVIGYEVPANYKELEVSFQPDWGKKIKFKYTK